jgi:membrane-associated phospholipid phosphatase
VAIPLFVVAAVIYWLTLGLPTDPILAALWLWLGTIAWSSDKPWRHHLGFVRDWIPIVLILVAYNFSRGLADNGVAPHITEMIDADKWMFHGTIPTVWAQEHLYDPNHIRWYDVLASWVYFSHFMVSLTVLAVLWFRRRPLWAAFLRRWFVLTAAGLVTYFVWPAAPPWWAAEHGYIAFDVMRLSTRGWSAIGLHSGGQMLSIGQALSNPVAAMPSLHSAFSMNVALFFALRFRKRWWAWLLLAYPVLMSLTLVYTGEHYITDALVGYAYVGVIYVAVGLAERWWARRAGRRVGAAAESMLKANAPAGEPALAAAGEATDLPSQAAEKSDGIRPAE